MRVGISRAITVELARDLATAPDLNVSAWLERPSADLGARGREDGTDEVAEVARAFNGMADELVRRTTALEASDRLRRQLLADVSHELMTPLTAVLGHLETLGMRDISMTDAQRQKQLTVASREANRLKRVIGDLLDIARVEDIGLRLDVQEVVVAPRAGHGGSASPAGSVHTGRSSKATRSAWSKR